MPRARSNGVELEYQTFGRPGDPAMLLVMGLGAQLIDWPEAFCTGLVQRGFFVIRYDNRDCGLSTDLDQMGVPDIAAVFAGTEPAPYRLADMATDAVGLLDALGIRRAHLVGASMGGMICQQLTIDHPDRVLSLCSIMSTTGDRSVGGSTPEAVAVLLRPAAATRAEAVAGALAASQVLGSIGFEASEDAQRRRAEQKYDRAYRPDGRRRQLAAIYASPDRTEALHKVSVPTVVIHGALDPLVDPSGGRATADAIPGAELVIIPGMGHGMPPDAIPAMLDAITRTARRA
ncbi:MAG: alpha/beta hydrolase [Micromonosporaceae bacterium]|nr:alpha/beta hydrolase [Micromonosporaceae bacterium]